MSLLEQEGIQITAALHDDEIPTTESLSVNVEDVRTLRAQLKQREEELDLVRATCNNKDRYMARQGESFEVLRQHGIRLDAQLAAMIAERDFARQEFTRLQQSPVNLQLQQQLTASQAKNERLTLALQYLSDLGGGNSEVNYYAKVSLKREVSLLPIPTERPPASPGPC